jgi:SAM-dependent methyltransferase
MPSVQDVQAYWDSNPLFSHELPDVGSAAFFRRVDEIKQSDVERFALGYWEFAEFPGKTLLDIGCGPGWLTVQYARGGAKVTAIDLTSKAVELTRAHLLHYGLGATVEQANAEQLPFQDDAFDVVVSSGVLHHTPDTQRAFREAYRVLKPGGIAKITLYRLGILHSPLVFPITRAMMRLLAVKHPGADMSRAATDVHDFVRQYDGAGNPIGIAKSDSAWVEDFERVGFHVVGVEDHFFPRRFLPFGAFMPAPVHRLLDSRLGTMAYYRLRRPT